MTVYSNKVKKSIQIIGVPKCLHNNLVTLPIGTFATKVSLYKQNFITRLSCKEYPNSWLSHFVWSLENLSKV